MFEEHEGVKNVMIREWTVYGAPVGAKNISTFMIIDQPYLDYKPSLSYTPVEIQMSTSPPKM